MSWEAEFGQSLWEHQGQRLTVGALRAALADAPDDAPVLVGAYDGNALRLHVPVDLVLETHETGRTRAVLTGGELARDENQISAYRPWPTSAQSPWAMSQYSSAQ